MPDISASGAREAKTLRAVIPQDHTTAYASYLFILFHAQNLVQVGQPDLAWLKIGMRKQPGGNKRLGGWCIGVFFHVVTFGDAKILLVRHRLRQNTMQATHDYEPL